MQPRVVVIATSIGYDGVPHAGGTYMRRLCDLMEPHTDLTVMVPGTRTNREAAQRPGAPRRTIPLGLEPARSLPGKALNRASLRGDGYWRLRRDPGMPYLPLLVGLARSREARELIRTAEVIDLQWSDSIRLVHLLRRLNPTARLVGTFHDVMSQSFSREPQDTPRERRYWGGVARRSRRHERRMVRALDRVLVFSEKDAALLGAPDAVVVRPPLARSAPVPHRPGAPAEGPVLVVSYLARDENDKAALWAIDQVWPRVVEEVPGARLRLVGGGATDALRERATVAAGVELAGFVDDLEAEYDAAGVCLVPVHQGAGVKFKTIEALLHGVPTVSTTVGVEGVGPTDLFTAVVDDAEGTADALVSVLREPRSFQEGADRAQRWAAREFGDEQFVDRLLRVWFG